MTVCCKGYKGISSAVDVAFPVAIHDMCTLGWLEHRSFVARAGSQPRYCTHRSVPALHAAYDKPLEFSQADMPNARRHIARTVLCGDM